VQAYWWKFSNVCLSKIIVGKEVCAEEQLDRFLDNIRGNAAVNLLQSLEGLFIGLAGDPLFGAISLAALIRSG
jgi:hypothetical protein